MFGIGGTELLVILVVALIVLGPKSVPQIARTLGKAMGEFRRVSTEFQRTLNTEIELEEHEKRKQEAERELFGDKKTDPARPEQDRPDQDRAAGPQDSPEPAPQALSPEKSDDIPVPSSSEAKTSRADAGTEQEKTRV